MKRGVRLFFLSLLFFMVFVIAAAFGIYRHHYSSAVQSAEEKMNVWKLSDWRSHKDFDLLSKSGSLIEGYPQATQFYYGKSLNDLSIAQAAMLAGMARSPHHHSPTKNIAQAKLRRDLVTDQMLSSKFISKGAAESAKKDML